MAKAGKKYRELRTKVDSSVKYPIDGAFDMLKGLTFAKFDESVDVAVRLNVNPRHADQNLRGAVTLPHGTGKTVRVLVFAKGDKEKEAQEAGADYVGGDDLVDKIKEGWFEFDAVIATPDMMGSVGKIGRLLGPRGLMPNPKVGTVTFDVGPVVRDAKGGRVEFRVDKAGIIHAPVGRKSFDSDKLQENMLELVSTLQKMRPQSVKGTYIKGISISSTMSPGLRLDSASVLEKLV